jgi:hypothetical protein
LSHNEEFEKGINRMLEEQLQITKPIKFFTPKEIRKIIQADLNAMNAPGYGDNVERELSI